MSLITHSGIFTNVSDSYISLRTS